MPNTPCKSVPNQDSANEVLNNQLQSKLELRGEIGPANYTPNITQPSIVRREKGDLEAHVVGVRECKQGTRWMPILVPFFTPNDSKGYNKERVPE